MPQFRKKPVEIDAVQWLGSNWPEVRDFVLPTGGMAQVGDDGLLFIDTQEGTMRADPGDWIIKGVEGEFYPCKPKIFDKTYEEV